MSHDFANIRPEPILDRKPVASPPAWSLMFTGVIVGIAIGVFGCVLFYLSGSVPPLNSSEIAAREASDGTSTTTASGLTASAINTVETASSDGTAATITAADPELTFEFYEVLRNTEVEVDAEPVQLTEEQAQRLGIAENPGQAEATIGSAADAQIPAANAANSVDEIGALIASRANFSTTPGSDEGLQQTTNPERNSSPAANLPLPRNGNYMLQSGAFQQVESATGQRDRLQGLGLQATIKQQNVTGRTLYLVQSGPYLDQNELAQAEQLLRSANINSMRISLR